MINQDFEDQEIWACEPSCYFYSHFRKLFVLFLWYFYMTYVFCWLTKVRMDGWTAEPFMLFEIQQSFTRIRDERGSPWLAAPLEEPSPPSLCSYFQPDNHCEADRGSDWMNLFSFLPPPTSVALINHSCLPSVIVTYNGTSADVRAVRDLKPGDEVRNSDSCR